MNISLPRFSALLALLLSAPMAFAAGPNLITNGDFDDGLTGWTEINPGAHYGGVDYQQRYLDNPSPTGGDNYGLSTLRGAYLNGSDPTTTKGIIQTVSGLTIGDTYTLSFYQTGSDFRWAGEGQYWQVTFGSQTLDGAEWHVPPGNENYLWNSNWARTDATGDSINANFRWTHSVLTFTATAATQTLTFREEETADTKANWDTSVTAYATPAILMIDGITLRDNATAPVPEAGTSSMVLAGLSALGFVATRRRKTKS